ncbi:MAG: glycosyltransferase family protein [Pirellulaceae bacterium]
MAKIFYSMCGEGRGHASRVRAMVESLRGQHEFVLFAPEQAHDFLAPRYPQGTPGIEVRRIPGLRFHYHNGRMNLTKTAWHAAGYLCRWPRLNSRLKRTIREERPDLVIADFEPALPRAARSCQIPFLSLNHQHFLVACDLSSLPWELQRWAEMMRVGVWAHHRGQRATIVSSFFRAPLRRGYESVLQVGPLLRPELKTARPSQGDYVLSYLRPNASPRILESLQGAKREVRVYGLGERPAVGCLKFFPLHERKFVDDLAGCSALIGAAGNQSLGEALYLGKPVLAIPEGEHYEQLINAHFLRQMGAGDWVTAEQVEPAHVNRFLDRLDSHAACAGLLAGKLDGTSSAAAEIERFLPPNEQGQKHAALATL